MSKVIMCQHALAENYFTTDRAMKQHEAKAGRIVGGTLLKAPVNEQVAELVVCAIGDTTTAVSSNNESAGAQRHMDIEPHKSSQTPGTMASAHGTPIDESQKT